MLLCSERKRQPLRIGYNFAMRMFLLMLSLLALPLYAFAVDCACGSQPEPCPACAEHAACAACAKRANSACTAACATLAELAADHSSACVIEHCTCRTGSSPCAWPRHRCAPTLYPCAPCLPVRCVAHKPLACIELCPTPVCLPRACHKPAVTMWVDDPCPVEPVLTGSRELITPECACAE